MDNRISENQKHYSPLNRIRKIKKWLCYYGSDISQTVMNGFDMIVFDGTYHPPLPKPGENRPVLLGYMSVGEVIENGPYWGDVKGESFLLKTNAVWNSWIVDAAHPEWRQLLFHSVAPDIIRQGFDGFFLDTFDSALGLPEAEGTAAFKRQSAALTEIVRKLRKRFPEKIVAVNRGMPILPAIADFIDVIVIEGFFSTFSVPDQTCLPTNDFTRKLLLDQLRQGLDVNSDLAVLTLDYADKDQVELADAAAEFSLGRGFVPYVANPRLDQIGHIGPIGPMQ